jgi:hypothetical protein
MGCTKNGLHLTRCITVLAVFLIYLHESLSLGFTSPNRFTRGGRPSVAMRGWFDFKPFHGSGSGESKAFQEEQWQLQQDILRERANKGLTKDKLKKKYQNKSDQPTGTDPKPSLASEKGSSTGIPPSGKIT